MAESNAAGGATDLLTLVMGGWSNVQNQQGQTSVPGITESYQNTAANTQAAQAEVERLSTTVAAEHQDSIDVLAIATAERNKQTADAVQGIYDQAIEPIMSGRALAEDNLTQALEQSREVDALRDGRPAFFQNPLRYIADGWKAARLEEKVAENLQVARGAMTNVNALVQLTGARMDEAIAKAQLQGVAADDVAVAAVNKGYMGTQMRLQGARSGLQLAQAAGEDVYKSSMANANFAFEQQQFDAQERERARQAAERKKDNSLRERETAMDDQAVSAYLMLNDKLPTARNLNEARAAVADLKLRRDRAGDDGFARLVRMGVVTPSAKNGTEARSFVLKGASVRDARLLGELTGDATLASMGAQVSAVRIGAIQEALKQRRYQEAQTAGYKGGMQQWVAEQGAAGATALRKEAEALARQEVGNMRVEDFLGDSASSAPVASSGLNLGQVGTGNVQQTQRFYSVSEAAAKVLAEPAVRVMLEQARVKGGTTQGTKAQFAAMYSAFKAAGIANPQAELFTVLRQHWRGTVKEREDVKHLVDSYGIRPPDRIYVQDGTGGPPLDVSSPERLRLLLEGGEEALNSVSITERLGAPIGAAAYTLATAAQEQEAVARKAGAASQENIIGTATGLKQLFGKVTGEAVAGAVPAMNSLVRAAYEGIKSDNTRRWQALPVEEQRKRLAAADGNIIVAMTDGERLVAAQNKPKPLTSQQGYIRLPKRDRARLMSEFGQLVAAKEAGTLTADEFEAAASAWQFRFQTAVQSAGTP